MKPIATDIYTFSNLVGGGCLSVDKTGILADLVKGYEQVGETRLYTLGFPNEEVSAAFDFSSKAREIDGVLVEEA